MKLTDSLDRVFRFVHRAQRALIRIGIVWFVWLVFFALVPFSRISEMTTDWLAIHWMNYSLSIWVLRSLEAYLLPTGVTLIAAGPFDAFTAVASTGAVLALAATVPYASWVLYRYVAPGLRPSGRQAIRNATIAGVGLFFAGGALGVAVLPLLYAFGIQIQVAAGLAPVLTLGGFIGTTVTFAVGLALLFQVPTIAYGLAKAGLLSGAMVRSQMPIAAYVSIGAAFVLSPGVGGGLIEVPIAALLFCLYLLAYRIVRQVEVDRRMEVAVVGVIEEAV